MTFRPRLRIPFGSPLEGTASCLIWKSAPPFPGWELLHGADRLLTEVIAGRDLLRHWVRLCVAMTVCAALYGAVLGSGTGSAARRLRRREAAARPSPHLGADGGLRLDGGGGARASPRFGQVAVLTFLALTVASLLLASLAPVAWFFNLSAPAPTPAARTAHNLLYLLHTAFVGACGLAGTVALWKAMGRLDAPRGTLRAVYAVWVAPPSPWWGARWPGRCGPSWAASTCPSSSCGRTLSTATSTSSSFTDILPHFVSWL